MLRRASTAASSLPRALVVCPGRGSYSSNELGTLSRLPNRDAWQATIQQADDRCRAAGISTISELDGLNEFDRTLHSEASHASALAFSFSVADYAARVAEHQWRPIGFVANSLGWHTATHLSGAPYL
jgi:[acyl-carrier-protein] S-malonyltransferase